MPACVLDHLVVAAASLEEGRDFVLELLGIEIPEGGRHESMGTHNCLMRLGSKSYLEVISIDPEAVQSERPRWYALDDPTIRAQLQSGPRLITWVVRTADIVSAVKASAIALGPITSVSRGSLSWRLTIPSDGHLPGDGVIPHIIEWDGGAQPWEEMPDFGCQLLTLTLKHPDPDWLRQTLTSICVRGFDFVSISKGNEAALTATISTPSGLVSL